jgi:hypothetical protein
LIKIYDYSDFAYFTPIECIRIYGQTTMGNDANRVNVRSWAIVSIENPSCLLSLLPIPTTTLSYLAQSPAADPDTIALLSQTQNFETAFDTLIASQYPEPKSFGDSPSAPKASLWKLFLKRIQQEICGTDDSLRSLIQDCKKNPGNATLVTGMITAIVNLSGFPLPIDSAIATAIALYLLHISIDVFCEWSSPTPAS